MEMPTTCDESPGEGQQCPQCPTGQLPLHIKPMTHKRGQQRRAPSTTPYLHINMKLEPVLWLSRQRTTQGHRLSITFLPCLFLKMSSATTYHICECIIFEEVVCTLFLIKPQNLKKALSLFAVSRREELGSGGFVYGQPGGQCQHPSSGASNVLQSTVAPLVSVSGSQQFKQHQLQHSTQNTSMLLLQPQVIIRNNGFFFFF